LCLYVRIKNKNLAESDDLSFSDFFGFAQFCSEDYSICPESRTNKFVHITNIAQKQEVKTTSVWFFNWIDKDGLERNG
jgi:hypothetical protein